MKEILLNKKDSEIPFVWKEDDKYFIEGIEYVNDINLLLSAVSEVQEVKYNDLFKRCSTKNEYWQQYFNYQWSGGGLVLWHNPTEMWEQELTRRGELFCSCGAKKFMYYTSLCPNCDIPKPDDKGAVSLIPLCTCLEHKHKLKNREIWEWIKDNYDFSNDSYINLENYYGEDLDEDFPNYLNMIDEVYPVKTTLFYISW